MGFNYTTLNEIKMWLAGLDVSDMPPTLDLIIEQSYMPWAKRQVDLFCGENFDSTTINEFYDGNGRIEIILNHRPVSFLRKCSLRIIPSLMWYDFRRWFHLNETDQLGITVASRGGVEPNNLTSIPPYTFPSGSPVPSDIIIPTGSTAAFNNTTTQYERADLFVNCKNGLLTIPPRILYLENQAIPFWNYTWLRGYGNIEVSYDYGYRSQDLLPQEIKTATAQLVAAAVLTTKGEFYGGGAMSLTLGSMPKSFGDKPFSGHIKSYIEGAKAALAPYKRIRA